MKKAQEPGIKLQKADFFRNDTWTSPQTNSEEAPKIPLVHFFNSRWPPPCNAIFEKEGYTLIPHLCSSKKIILVSPLMFWGTKSWSKWSEMKSALFSIPKILNGRHIVLIMLSDLSKNTKIWDIYLVVEPKMYFSAKPMESSTYLDHHYFVILNLSTSIPYSS